MRAGDRLAGAQDPRIGGRLLKQPFATTAISTIIFKKNAING
jgi:hypothetical protein